MSTPERGSPHRWVVLLALPAVVASTMAGTAGTAGTPCVDARKAAWSLRARGRRGRWSADKEAGLLSGTERPKLGVGQGSVEDAVVAAA